MGKADSSIDQGYDDKSVDARFNHAFSEEADRDGVGVAGMEMEDRVGARSPLLCLIVVPLPPSLSP